jgi:hypothetical protein
LALVTNRGLEVKARQSDMNSCIIMSRDIETVFLERPVITVNREFKVAPDVVSVAQSTQCHVINGCGSTSTSLPKFAAAVISRNININQRNFPLSSHYPEIPR